MTRPTPDPDATRRTTAREPLRGKLDGPTAPADLQEYVAQMRDRKPEEVLGAVAQSSLVSSVIFASFLTVAVIALATVGPYAWGKSHPAHKKVAAQKAKPAESAPASAPSEPTETQSAATAAGDKPKLDERTLKRLGVDEAKNADPSSNPLENKGDDLLNDLK